MSDIKAVLFDIGNVLITWEPEKFYDRTVGEQRRRALFAAVDLYGMNDRADRGEPLPEMLDALVAKHPEFQVEIRMWQDNWIEFITGEIPKSIALLRVLRSKGMPVFALTNFGAETLDLADRHFGFLTEFDRRYVSAHMRMMKPDPEIYAAVEADSGLAPDSLLFTDDRPENIEAAVACGWNGHVFDGPDGWAQALVSHGVLTGGEAAV